jgi:hypothetical protein
MRILTKSTLKCKTLVRRVPAKETNQLLNTEMDSEVLVYWLTYLKVPIHSKINCAV